MFKRPAPPGPEAVGTCSRVMLGWFLVGRMGSVAKEGARCGYRESCDRDGSGWAGTGQIVDKLRTLGLGAFRA